MCRQTHSIVTGHQQDQQKKKKKKTNIDTDKSFESYCLKSSCVTTLNFKVQVIYFLSSQAVSH